jgi:hypothetical protein
VVRASDGHSSGAFAEGQRVKVVANVKVFHVPRSPAEGIQLEGMEGVVTKDVTQYKGKILSANLPYFIEFNPDPTNPKSKFKSHLVRWFWQVQSRCSYVNPISLSFRERTRSLPCEWTLVG